MTGIKIVRPGGSHRGSREPHAPGQVISDDDRMTSSWAIRHFSQANPVGTEQGDVPALLRRVADSIEELGSVEIQDLVLHQEITDDGPWFSVTVYFHQAESGADTGF
jgi:hypothetical protein